jgi:hypothetical protein
MRDEREEPFLAPSADGPQQTRKKVLAGKGLMRILLCIAVFIFPQFNKAHPHRTVSYTID